MADADTRTKQQIIADALKTPQGRQKLAMSMIQPLRRRRDYSALASSLFPIQQLPDPDPAVVFDYEYTYEDTSSDESWDTWPLDWDE